MKQTAELFQALTESGKVRGIRRYNLRKFCRSMGLPPLGVSFLTVDDLNWDYLHNLNRLLTHDRIWFQGGEHFPRSYWDNYFLGHDRRTEYIYLGTGPRHHQQAAAFFHRYFSGVARIFGEETTAPENDSHAMRSYFSCSLTQDLIYFAEEQSGLIPLSDFYMCLYFLTCLNTAPANTVKEEIMATFSMRYPQFRSNLTRVSTTSDVVERLNDLLWLIYQIEKKVQTQ